MFYHYLKIILHLNALFSFIICGADMECLHALSADCECERAERLRPALLQTLLIMDQLTRM